MSDPVETPSKTPNQPAVETPAAAATPVAASPPADPTLKPAAETPPAAAAAPTETPPPAADSAAAAAAKTAEAPKPTDAEIAAQAAADAEAAKAAAAPVIPETYEIQVPKALADQGLSLNPDVIPALAPALKKAGLTQTQLQTVAEAFIDFQAKVPARMLERDLEVTMKDPDVGGLNYGRTQGHVNAALSAFTHPEFRSLLNKTGLANNLEFVRVFERIGKAMSGDAPARGTPDGAPQLSRAERLYGKTTPTT
jgi:hypothetical protein